MYGIEKESNVLNGLFEVMQYQFKTYNIAPNFPNEFTLLNEDDFCVPFSSKRQNFTTENVFTIDCKDCKDMDDAVSITKTAYGYRLCVHIADVAAYIPLGSELDKIASYRATSIYLPSMTIPMLPRILSNDLCSLNPGVERYTLSVIMELDNCGKVINSEVVKGIIKSRVKGIYKEVNDILSGSQDKSLLEKYTDVYNDLFLMESLYEVLRTESIARGATTNDTNKPKITINCNKVDITPYTEGVAENMIEEFMILANHVIAEYLCNNDLPAIFRIQEERNNMAAYQPTVACHAELALESYSHFTSPIRRIADLKIHQIITMYLDGVHCKTIHELFDEALVEVCERATKRSRTASQVQEKCERYCYAEFFKSHKDEVFTGTFVGYDKKNRPLIQIDLFNIKVHGSAFINYRHGDRMTFNVSVSDNALFTKKANRIAS